MTDLVIYAFSGVYSGNLSRDGCCGPIKTMRGLYLLTTPWTDTFVCRFEFWYGLERMPFSPITALVSSVAAPVLQQAASTLTDVTTSFANMLHDFVVPSAETQEKQPTAPAKEKPAFQSITDAANALNDHAAQAAKFKTALAKFQKDFARHLAEAGVETSEKFQLESDEFDRVVVTNQHPDRSRIERIFSDNPDLQDTFQQLAAMADASKAGHFTLTVEGDSMEVTAK